MVSSSPLVRDYDPRDPPRFGEWVRVQGMASPAVETDDAPTQPNGAPLPSEYLAPLDPLPESPRESSSYEVESAFDARTKAITDSSFELRASLDNPRRDLAHRRARAQRLGTGVLLLGALLLGGVAYRNSRHEFAQAPLPPAKISPQRNFTASFPKGEWRFHKAENSIPGAIKSESWLLTPAPPEKFTETFTVSYFAFAPEPRSLGNDTALKEFLARKFKRNLKRVTNGVFEVSSAPASPSRTHDQVRFVVREKSQLEVWKLDVSTPHGKSNTPNPSRVRQFFNSFKPANPPNRSTAGAGP
jgi:hypothetical protein